MTVNVESNPFLYYVVATDEEAARYRLLDALQTAQSQLRDFSLYPQPWQAMSARHLALVALQQQEDFYDEVSQVVGIDWEARRIERQVVPHLTRNLVMIHGRLESLAEMTKALADATVDTLDFWCTKCVTETRLYGVTPKSLEHGFVYTPGTGDVYRWHWNRLVMNSQAMVSCAVSDSGLKADVDTDPGAVYRALPYHDTLGFVVLEADVWPPDQESRRGLIRQVIIRYLAGQPR